MLRCTGKYWLASDCYDPSILYIKYAPNVEINNVNSFNFYSS